MSSRIRYILLVYECIYVCKRNLGTDADRERDFYRCPILAPWPSKYWSLRPLLIVFSHVSKLTVVPPSHINLNAGRGGSTR